VIDKWTHRVGYITVSTKVRKEVVERAKSLGINLSEFLRKKIEEVERRELELIMQKPDSLKDVLDAIDVERIVRYVREDREGPRCQVTSSIPHL